MDGFRLDPPYGTEFHQRLIVARGVETDRHVLVPVRVDEEQAPEQDPVGIKCGTGRSVGTDTRRGVGQPLLVVLQETPLRISSLSNSCRRSSSEQTDVGGRSG